MKDYWLVDQVKSSDYIDTDYKLQFDKLFRDWQNSGTRYLSLLMQESFEEWLIEKGFRKNSAIVEYSRSLSDLLETESDFTAPC